MKQFIPILILGSSSLQIAAQPIDKIQLERTIDSLFASFDDPNSPGVAITVLQDGQVLAKKNYGMANLEHAIPYTHQSPVRLIYSMGREFMCAGLAIMETEDFLRFDDKVRSYLPKLPEWSKDVTIQDLLDHKSGFADEWGHLLLLHADMRNRVDKEQMLRLLYDQTEPQIEPGVGYMYNNTDIALLRMVMEMASRKNLPEYLKEKLFDPLGMSSTFMNDDIEAVIPGFAESYYGNDPVRKARFYKTSPGGNYRMVTSAADLEKWAGAIDDPSSFLAKSFLRLYQDAGPIPTLSPERHYTFGHEWRNRDTMEYVYHGGVGNSFYMFRIPSQRVTVISLGNGGEGIWAFMQLTNSLLPGDNASARNIPVFPSEQVPLTKDELAEYAGRYFGQDVEHYNSHVPLISFYDITLEGDSLNFFYTPTASFRMIPFGNGFFNDDEGSSPMQFTRTHPDSVMKLQAWSPDGETQLKLHRITENTIGTREYLEQFTGRFYSPHLDYYCRITLNEEGQLTIERPTVSDKIMEPYGPDRFFFEVENGATSFYMSALFTKNEKDEIDGFIIKGTRVMHQRFKKVE